MKLRPINEFKAELEEKLKVSHPGNLQVEIGDKLFLYYAESHDNEYDDDDNELMTGMFLSVGYYGEHHDVIIRKKDTELSISYTSGELSNQLWEFIDEELEDYIQVIWNAVENWTLY